MRIMMALLMDVLIVFVFTVAERASHAERITPAGLVTVAWPFLIGLAVGWLVTRSWRDPLTIGSALGVWLCTVAVGVWFRGMSWGGAQPSFVMVSLVVLGYLLTGWRLMVFLIRGVRRRRRAAAAG